jgi:hypothetical protein
MRRGGEYRKEIDTERNADTEPEAIAEGRQMQKWRGNEREEESQNRW